jgi:hypothetical protein
MKKFLLIAAMVVSYLYAYEATRPVEHFNVRVVIERGDTLQDVICDLQEKYGDKRDWREVCWHVCKLNGITKWIYPGDVITVPLEVKKW